MSICDGCIHDYVCGLEDNHEEGIVSCADRIPKDALNKMGDDVISRQAVLEKAVYTETEEGWCGYTVDVDYIKSLPPVNPQESKIGHCKDCKYFEYDYAEIVDGIPLILAHEFCKRWGDGCKTKEDGYCFLYEEKK